MNPARLALLLPIARAACEYSDTPYGRYARIDLPVENRTVIHKTVTVNAPPGTTVIYQDSEPVHRYGYPYPPYPRPYPARRVYRY